MNRRVQQSGFSLVELMVASALFMTVVAVAAGSFISVLDASRDSREMAELMANIDFVLEDMSRNIRVGEDYSSPTGALSSGASSISFNVVDGDDSGSTECTLTYRLEDSVVKKSKSSGAGCDGYSSLPLTAEEIEITNLTFTGDQVGSTGVQPRIIINIAGKTTGEVEQEFKMQTSVTQRALNY